VRLLDVEAPAFLKVNVRGMAVRGGQKRTEYASLNIGNAIGNFCNLCRDGKEADVAREDKCVLDGWVWTHSSLCQLSPESLAEEWRMVTVALSAHMSQRDWTRKRSLTVVVGVGYVGMGYVGGNDRGGSAKEPRVERKIGEGIS
jgi:hypothetical protein